MRIQILILGFKGLIQLTKVLSVMLSLQNVTKLTASALNFTVLGAAIKAVVETVSALDGESHRSSTEKKFSLLCKMARYVIFTARVHSECGKSDYLAKALMASVGQFSARASSSISPFALRNRCLLRRLLMSLPFFHNLQIHYLFLCAGQIQNWNKQIKPPGSSQLQENLVLVSAFFVSFYLQVSRRK